MKRSLIDILDFSVEEIEELLSAHPSLRVCFDTNHLLGGRCPLEFVREIGDKIVSLHVSDYDGIDEKHWLPGEGIVDWAAIMDALDEVGYDGPFLYELGTLHYVDVFILW